MPPSMTTHFLLIVNTMTNFYIYYVDETKEYKENLQKLKSKNKELTISKEEMAASIKEKDHQI